ncbi:MAG: glycosyltransferase family 39 protein [Anaerolineae bacterium]|nr:glycosyltransferase family 39 protein [Anaerolineae bacterium]MDQ7034200.1 glycosyltransferase family 39 protein [Anaerolineae bacterium]
MLRISAKQFIPLIVVTLLLLIAAFVRFHNLGVQSLWYDEGVAYGHSQRNLFEMIPLLRNNVHVPAYFASLSLWEDFVGSTEFGLRSYSVLWSILGVAATYALGKRLFSPIAGMSAAAFVILNTFSIYYAQETRMYAMMATIGALSMWVFAGLWQRLLMPSHNSSNNLWKWGVALAVLNTVGAYTHFSYALVMLAQGALAILALGNLLKQYIGGDVPFDVLRRAFVIYFLANLATILLFSPWLVTAISQVSAQPNISDTVSWIDMNRILQGWMSYGITYQETLGSMNFVVYFFLIFAFLAPEKSQSRTWWRMLLPIVWVLLSIAVYSTLGLYTRYLRFLLPAQIGFALWMGRGVWMLWQVIPRAAQNPEHSLRTRLARQMPKIASFVAVAAFSYTLANGIPPLYNDADYQRDDYRQLAQIIAEESQPDDAIILSAPGLQEIFGYYYDGDLPIFTLPASDDIAGDTHAIIAEYDRLFTVLYGNREQDPQGLVTATLNNDAYQINAEWIGNIRLERYATPAQFDDAQRLNVAFGDSITLESVAFSATTVSRNDALQIQLQWITESPLETRYKVFVQLLNADGTLAAQRDSEPSGGQAMTTLWQVGETVIDNHALAIPADLPDGNYTLIIGLYDANNPNDRLPVGDSDFLELGAIVVE